MASKAAMHGSLRRSKTSLNSLSSLSSDPSLSPGGRSMGMRSTNISSSSSSLYLQVLAESSSSFPSSKPTLQRQTSSMSSSTLSVESANMGESGVVENPSNLIQWAVLLALALQIPNIMEEIRVIIDLHYHSFPLLVVLGTFPAFLKRKRNARTPEDPDTFSLDKSARVSSKSTIEREGLTDLQYGGISRTICSDSGDGDEWGHFADLDWSTTVFDHDEKLSVASSRRTTLTTLKEAEDEE